jgi:signal transduction histidine kinase
VRATVRAIRPTVPDRIIAVVVTLFVVAMTVAFARWHRQGSIDALGVLWLIAGTAPLLWRLRAPGTVFLVSSALVFTYYWSSYAGGPSIIAPTLALVTLTFLRGPLMGCLAGGILVVAVATVILVQGDTEGALDPRLLGFGLWIAVAVSIGTVVRYHRAAVRSSAERAAEADRRHAEEQRLAIAREVHDVVAHSLAMINVQAGVAAHVADRRPEQAKAALLAIKEASRSALVDLRATLGVLRSGDDRAPTPGLGRLPDLIEVASATGITVHADGDPGVLPAPVDVASYRIVQECLTNVVRHGQGADVVTIRLVRTPEELEITVLDNGTSTTPARHGGHGHGGSGQDGNGLRGMAERAEALGGSVVAGPESTGGFRVFARLPLTGETL